MPSARSGPRLVPGGPGGGCRPAACSHGTASPARAVSRLTRDDRDWPVCVIEQRVLYAADTAVALPADHHEVRAAGVAREHMPGVVMHHVAPYGHAVVLIPPWRERLREV